ncbi:TlyA family RNA methyltransferase [Solicola gregarius]|uniref:TlyA family RNA methyltransferase n=1 Tax=Solicola gregarius TaxID=2908642 RepID=A0AA46TH06_9ACTN|nr:TlyA family RNA methyltransferase [Solicola gregarius]UYM05197.1 TlyA family RNA methyltransferase [Solicola gregarius]
MTKRLRLDAELVRRGLARSREEASTLIADGAVTVGGLIAQKPATGVSTDQAIVVRERDETPSYASRGAHKLIGALDEFGPDGLEVEGRRCLDAGASTGGFTDVLLRRGAASVVAVDVGYGQLAWSLRNDPRVEVHDRTNVRHLSTEQIGGAVDLVTSDLSFISLTVVLPALSAVSTDGGDQVLMVKPQFEVGKGRLGKNGVVREPALRVEAILSVCGRAAELGWGTRGLAASPLPGPAGNVEYFCWLRRDADPADPEHAAAVVAGGPDGEKVT